MFESTIQSYLLYASALAVGIYLGKEGYSYFERLVTEKSYETTMQILMMKFDTLSLIFNKEKVIEIKTQMLNANNQFMENKIKYPEWKVRIKQTVDEIFDLFDDYYR